MLERGRLPLPYSIRYTIAKETFTFLPRNYNLVTIQGLSLVLTVLFRFLAGLLIWVLLIALVLGSLGGTGYLWYE